MRRGGSPGLLHVRRAAADRLSGVAGLGAVSDLHLTLFAEFSDCSAGEKVDLNNAAGALGPLQMSMQCNFSGNAWVGCCQ
jgi:hypothetical protein